MNDYASALLYVMREESLAYVCFCSVMKRIRGNFTTDGVTIGTKLLHLKVLLKAIDPIYWNFFESCDAGKEKRIEISSQLFSFFFFSESFLYISLVTLGM